jgi:hypothetical protein
VSYDNREDFPHFQPIEASAHLIQKNMMKATRVNLYYTVWWYGKTLFIRVSD